MTKNLRLIFFGIAAGLLWFSMFAYVPILSPYAESLGATHKAIGIMVGSYGFVQMLLRLPVGILSDRLNKRRIFTMAGLFLCGISALGMFYSKSPELLIVFRALTGVGSCSWVVFTVLYTSYFDKQDSSKALGILTACCYFGQVVAMFLSGIIAQQFGQRYTFLLAFIGGAIGLILCFTIEENTETKRKPIRFGEILEVSRNYNLLIVSSIAAISQIVAYSTVYGFVPVAAKAIGASSFQLGMVSTLSMLPCVFASALSGTYFTKRIGERNSIVAGFVVTSLTCLVIPFIKDVNVFIFTQVIAGFGRGIVYPLLMSLSIKNIEYSKRATAMGFFQSVYALGMFIGPVMVGFLSDFAGLNWGFVAVGVVSAIGALSSLFLIKINKKASIINLVECPRT